MTKNTIRQITRRSSIRLTLAVAAALILTGRGLQRVAVLAQTGNPVSVENGLTGVHERLA